MMSRLTEFNFFYAFLAVLSARVTVKGNHVWPG